MPVEGVHAYPLDWPPGWDRTQHPARGRYHVPFARARDEVLNTLRLMGVSRGDVVISSNVALKRDGFPYADGREPKDAGVAVYWVRRGSPQVIASDRWNTVRSNLRAVGYALEGLRTIERCGATYIVDRAYLGFKALPPNIQKQTWRQVLGISSYETTEAEIRLAYKAGVMRCHPDRGGKVEQMVELNNALTEALQSLKQVANG